MSLTEKKLEVEHHDAHIEKASSSESDKAEPSIGPSPIESGSEWTVADEKRIVRMMDLRLVPVVWLLYLLCFIDR